MSRFLRGGFAASEAVTRTSLRYARAGSWAGTESAQSRAKKRGVEEKVGADGALTPRQRFPFAFDKTSGLAQLFDVDANVCHEQLIKDRDEHLKKALRAGVEAMLVPASSAATAVEIHNFVESASASLIPRVFTTAGIHPYEASEELASAETNRLSTDMDLIRGLLTQYPGNVVAVGECGLDYSEGFPVREAQQIVFETQVALACELQRPLFLHVRKAFDDCFRILDKFDGKDLPPIIVHCFTGNVDDLRACLSRGYSLSVSGLICREEAGRELRDALACAWSEGLLDLQRPR